MANLLKFFLDQKLQGTYLSWGMRRGVSKTFSRAAAKFPSCETDDGLRAGEGEGGGCCYYAREAARWYVLSFPPFPFSLSLVFYCWRPRGAAAAAMQVPEWSCNTWTMLMRSRSRAEEGGRGQEMISNQQAASNPRSTAVCSVGGGTQLEEGEALFGVMRAGATAPVMGLSSGFSGTRVF